MRRGLAALLLALLAGCPDSKTTSLNPNPAGGAAPPPLAPPPPPPRPRTGWGAVGTGSSFETLTKIHMANGLPDTERTTVQTVAGFEGDFVKVHLTITQEGVPTQDEDTKFPIAADEAKPEGSKESVTVKAGIYDCECTTETSPDATTKTWRTKALPVPVKVEVKGPQVTSVAELVKADVR